MITAPGTIYGTSFGQRYVSVEGKYIAFDLENRLILELSSNPDKKQFWQFGKEGHQDIVRGGIYKIKQKEFQKNLIKLGPQYWKFKGIEKDWIEQKIHDIEGRWTKQVFLDNKEVIWDAFRPQPPKIQIEEASLPSDSWFREDLIALRAGNFDQAQEMKELLENIQRNDKKLRMKKLQKN
ncbi:PH domain protein [Ichthyophthirius multifiliis]|uniref:PH domain protein n=1 Tax=Ichthyophthirius multifiliis TaxID=5932 RepID=G0R085_ICHMU|nr:PH domain protein [Ichthyophthirius multifiliis]EGR29117.1 PH domain protein [Ichthyophthirius multifiliis]|eukprot:XP_004030353.1 PH domain protein [Ichthyophthirius multifiliis]